MKNILAIIIVLVLIVAGVFLLKGNSKNKEVNESEDKSAISDMDNMPASNSSGSETINTNVDASLGVTVGSVKEFTVNAQNFSFSPSSMTVNKGDKVKITFNNTQGFHDFVLPDFNVKSKQAQGPYTEVFEFTADKAGSFEYYCSVGSHRAMGMKGTFTVK